MHPTLGERRLRRTKGFSDLPRWSQPRRNTPRIVLKCVSLQSKCTSDDLNSREWWSKYSHNSDIGQDKIGLTVKPWPHFVNGRILKTFAPNYALSIRQCTQLGSNLYLSAAPFLFSDLFGPVRIFCIWRSKIAFNRATGRSVNL